MGCAVMLSDSLLLFFLRNTLSNLLL